MAFTCAYRRQAQLCSKLASYPGSHSKKFLYQGHEISPGVTLLLNNLPNGIRMFSRYVAEADRTSCQLLRTNKVKIYGTTYLINSNILLKCTDDTFPLFGEINSIFILNATIFFMYSVLHTLSFNDKLNAYRVQRDVNNLQDIISIENLIFPHPLISVTVMDCQYVGLLNHERNEFF